MHPSTQAFIDAIMADPASSLSPYERLLDYNTKAPRCVVRHPYWCTAYHIDTTTHGPFSLRDTEDTWNPCLLDIPWSAPDTDLYTHVARLDADIAYVQAYVRWCATIIPQDIMATHGTKGVYLRMADAPHLTAPAGTTIPMASHHEHNHIPRWAVYVEGHGDIPLPFDTPSAPPTLIAQAMHRIRDLRYPSNNAREANFFSMKMPSISSMHEHTNALRAWHKYHPEDTPPICGR